MAHNSRHRRGVRETKFQKTPFEQPRTEWDGAEPETEPRGTSNEVEHLRRLVDEKTPVVVHLRTGESFRGFIEYYDKRFLRLTRSDAPNLFILKQDIRYLSEE